MSSRKTIALAAAVAVAFSGLVANAPLAGAKAKPKAPGKVSSVKVSGVTASGATLSWRNPTSTKKKPFKGTVVRVAFGTKAPSSVKSGSAVATLGAKSSAVRVSRLRAGAVYTVSIFSRGSANKYSSARVARLQTAPAGVTGVYGQATINSIKVVWKLPSKTAVRTVVRYAANATPGTLRTGSGAPVSGRATTVTIAKLRFGTLYGISLWAVDKAGRISPRVSIAIRTAPPTSGGVTGVVSEQGTGKRLGNADVSLYSNETDDSYEATTTANGSFSLTGVTPGTYRLRVYGDNVDGGTSEAGYVGFRLDSVKVKAGDPIAFAVQLERGAGVAGLVVDADTQVGVPDTDIEVEYANDFAGFDEDESDEDGSFTITEISAQNADSICFSSEYVEADSADSVTGYRPNCIDVPGDVTLVPGAITQLPGSIALTKGGALGGTINFGLSSEYAYVSVFDSDGTQVGDGYADADDDGLYKVGGLPTGEQLYVCVDPDDDVYPAACYNSGGSVEWNGDTSDLPPLDELTPVQVTKGDTTKGINFDLNN